MPKENGYPFNVQSPFSPDLDVLKRDNQKSERSLAQTKDTEDSNASMTMDGGVPSDSIGQADANYPE